MTANDGGSTWRSWAPLAAVIALVMFVVPLGIHFPLLDPDEGLHAGIAQEMVERGNWITPSFLGEPFLDKPILNFWAQAVSLWLFGPSEAAARLPGLMFGLLGAATTGLLAWRMFGAATGWIAGILYATTILPTAMAQAATHDVALIPWINLALLMLWESQRGGKGDGSNLCDDHASMVPACGPFRQIGPVPFSALYILGAGFFVGLSILTKGLIGVAVVGLAYGGYRLISWRVGPALVLQGVVVLLVAALIAAPWYVALEIHNPGYLRYYFIDRHLLGLATTSQAHGNQPWWYYFPLLLGGGLPWIGYLPFACSGRACPPFGTQYAAGKPARYTEQTIPGPSSLVPLPSPLLWFWLFGWVVLLTAARSKLATYLLPAFPPVAILAAVAWSRWGAERGTGPICATTMQAWCPPEGRSGKLDLSPFPPLGDAARRSFARTFVWSSWSGPIMLPTAVLAVQLLFDVRFPWPVWAATALAAAVAPLPLIPWRAGRWRAALAAAALSMAAQFTVAMTLVLPTVAERFSARDLAEHFNRAEKLPPRLFVVEERIGSVVFYLDPKLRAGLTADRLSRLSLERPPRLQPGDAVAIPRCKFDEKGGAAFDLGDNPYESVGRYRLYRITKPPPGS